MARIEVSSKFEEQVILLNNIETKVSGDGVKSPLIQMLINKGIVLVDDVAIGVIASKSNVDFLAKGILGQEFCRKRDDMMGPIMIDVNGSFQFLKEHYAPVFISVGLWGAVITNNGKITNSKTTHGEVSQLAQLKTQNDSYKLPAVSPLAPYLIQQSIDLTVDTTNAALGLGFDTSMHASKIAGEICREHRDKIWKLPLKHIHAIGNFLMKLFKGDAKLVGEYGFNVILTAKVNKPRKISIAFTQNKLNVKVPIGSVIVSTGTEIINIYKGKIISGTAIVLGVGKKWIVTKGFSNLSFENVSAVNFADFIITPPIV